MRKFSAIACTIGFSMFWIFGGLALVSLFNGHPVGVVVPLLCASGLVLGIVMRRVVVKLTLDVPTGTRIQQQETAAA